MTETFDHIVVGGGSAGCVASARLAAGGRRVLVLEAGPAAEEHPKTLTADGYKDTFINDDVYWERFTSPENGLRNRRIWVGSGRTSGGSGSVNGMVYTRGAKEDYDSWPAGWQWADIASGFERIEAKIRPRQRPPTAFTSTFLKATEDAGFRVSDDLNNGDLSGVFGYESMNYEGDARRSSYVAFIADKAIDLRPVFRNRALVHRVLFERGRAVGVEYECEGRRLKAYADGDIVLAAGALETPKLLMLSGVGPADHLRDLGLGLTAHSPEIGENLHDHPNVTLFHLGKNVVDCHYPQLYGFDRANPALPLPAGTADTCYVMYPAPSSFRQALKRMLPTLALSENLYRHRLARSAVRGAIDVALRTRSAGRLIEHLYGVVVILGKPLSRGRLMLRSKNPNHTARIAPNYFGDPRDMDTMVLAVKRAREIAGADPLARWGNRELHPGKRKNEDDSIRRFIAKNAMTTFHYAGSCRMGEDQSAPVDPALRLRGLDNIRIADASVIPVAPVAALNAPSMLIGDRAAALMLEAADGNRETLASA